MKAHPFALVGWLLAATLLLSLVGLTAEPLPATEIGARDLTNAWAMVSS